MLGKIRNLNMPIEKKFYLTQTGLDKLKKEYRELKKVRLSKTKGGVPKILHSEDLDPEYLTLQEDLSFLAYRINELKNILENAEIIQVPPKNQRDTVHLGALVTLQEKSGGENEFMIVGTLEANPSEGKISSESPVGKALLGKKMGEEVFVTSPIKVVYKVKKIKYPIS